MKHIFCLAALILLCAAISVLAQDEPAKELSLSDAQTIPDVRDWVRQEEKKHDFLALDIKSESAIQADINMQAGNRMLELADGREKWEGYNRKLYAYNYQMEAGIEGAEQELERFLEHLARNGEAEVGKTTNDGFLRSGHFFLFRNRMMKMEPTPENIDKFKSELKIQIGWQEFNVYDIVKLGFQFAEINEIPATQFVGEMVEYIQSPECPLSETEKTSMVTAFERSLRRALGVDPKLYGKTLDDEDFHWESLRGKYVLVQFTATWCGPCHLEIPGMKEAYTKYHDKGFEIVSVYIRERGSNDEQVVAVKQSTEKANLPWIVLSEALTEKAGQLLQSDSYFYQLYTLPTMVLADKDGKIIMTRARGIALQTKLAEIFE